jgi:hypothetical protein
MRRTPAAVSPSRRAVSRSRRAGDRVAALVIPILLLSSFSPVGGCGAGAAPVAAPDGRDGAGGADGVGAPDAVADVGVPDGAARDGAGDGDGRSDAGGEDLMSDGADAQAPDAALPDVATPDAGGPDAADEASPPPRPCVLPEGGRVAGGERYTDGTWQTTVAVEGAPGCARRFVLTSDAPLRPAGTAPVRTIAERADRPSLQTGHDLLDALYALTLEEVGELSVDAIRDGAFDRGEPLACPPGGCFETGAEWHYVWTRDTAYAVDLGLAEIDPLRSLNSLEFKLSERRDGGDLQVVQDTGTGGSYPISTDRVAWALGATRLLSHLPDDVAEDFRERAREALGNTVEHDRVVAWDPVDGLYRGEQSFLDWREQSYAEWTADDPVHIGVSKALSTNVLHLRALRLAASLAARGGETDAAARYEQWAEALRDAIRAELWLEEEGLFATLRSTTLAPSAVRRFDLLGSALAVLEGVATPAQAARIVASYPHVPFGAPVQWPQQQDTPIYHNRALWPFVTAYWARAAQAVRNGAAVDHAMRSLVRGTALNLSNMENLEMVSGRAFLDDGPMSGPVVNSRRQLWSVAAFVSLVHDVLFGIDERDDGVAFRPFVTGSARRTWFAGMASVALNDVPLRGRRVTVVVHLPPDAAGDGPLDVERVEHDGAQRAGGDVPWAALADGDRVDVWLVDRGEDAGAITLVTDTADWRRLFGPRTPRVTAVLADGAALAVALDGAGEDPATIAFHVYRDGVRVAADLPGASTLWRDEGARPDDGRAYCYSVETTFVATGAASQHAPPNCWWGPGYERVQTITAEDFDCECDCVRNDNHGRLHCEPWGDPGDRLVIAPVTTAFDGPHLLQLVAGNGAGPISTGVTCGVKRLRVERVTDGVLVAEGLVLMPQLGDWGRWRDSSLVRAALAAGVEYRVVVDGDDPRAVNMSVFAHFEAYTGGEGGASGPFNRQNVAALKILAL